MLTVPLRAHVYQRSSVYLPTVIPSAPLMLNVLAYWPASNKNVKILAQDHAVYMQIVTWPLTYLFVHVQKDISVTRSLNVNLNHVCNNHWNFPQHRRREAAEPNFIFQLKNLLQLLIPAIHHLAELTRSVITVYALVCQNIKEILIKDADPNV